MSTREDVGRLLTDEGRALVAQFVAESANEDDDVDFDAVAQQNLADHEAALAGEKPAGKPARPKTLRPFIGYLVENAGKAPVEKTPLSWKVGLPAMFTTVKDARAEREGFRAMSPTASDKVVLKVTITYEVVEDGARG